MNSEIFARSTALTGLALAAAFSLAACNTTTGTESAAAADDATVETAAATIEADDAGEASAATADGSIVDALQAAGSFNTLLTTLDGAGLLGTLGADGSYTLFAPTDEAFAALPPGTVDALMLPENRSRLTQILSYHVIAGEELSSTSLAGQEVAVATMEGRTLSINGTNGIKVDNATVIATDVEASNGIIQVIDTVLIP